MKNDGKQTLDANGMKLLSQKIEKFKNVYASEPTPTQIWKDETCPISAEIRKGYYFSALQKGMRTFKTASSKIAQHNVAKKNFISGAHVGFDDAEEDEDGDIALQPAFDIKKKLLLSGATQKVTSVKKKIDIPKVSLAESVEDLEYKHISAMMSWKPAYLMYPFPRADGRLCLGFEINLPAGTDEEKIDIHASGTVLSITAAFPKNRFSIKHHHAMYGSDEIKKNKDLELMMNKKRTFLQQLHGSKTEIEPIPVYIDLPFPVVDTRNPEQLEYGKGKNDYLAMEFYLMSTQESLQNATKKKKAKTMTFSQSP